MQEPTWRRNFIQPSVRFKTPLYVYIPTNAEAEGPFITDTDNYEAKRGEGDDKDTKLRVVISQRLETVNCLWDASTVLCGYLAANGKQVLEMCSQRFETKPSLFRVIEIGSGTGALGILAAKSLRQIGASLDNTLDVRVIMTDMEQEVSVLQDTIAANFDESEIKGSSAVITAEPLLWGSSQDCLSLQQKYQVDNLPWIHLILATDIVYELQHFDLLMKTLHDLSPRRNGPLFLMAFEKRWSDITGFWWEEVKSSGWKWETIKKGSAWYDAIEAIDIVILWRE